MRDALSWASVVGLLSAMVLAAPSWGADRAMENVAKERHDNFETLGKAWKGMEREAKKRAPDAAQVQKYASDIDRLAQDQANWFPVGSGPDAGMKTKAKADVWTKPVEFQNIHERFLHEAAKLKEVAFSSDLHPLAAQVEATGQACSDCHQSFRKQGGLFSVFGG